jgi:hypothetical protein
MVLSSDKRVRKGKIIKHPNAQTNKGANENSNSCNANDPRVQLSQALANLAVQNPMTNNGSTHGLASMGLGNGDK